jgi:hypothetical protein
MAFEVIQIICSGSILHPNSSLIPQKKSLARPEFEKKEPAQRETA